VEYSSPLSKRLVEVLAGTFAFYTRSHAAHWNVTGPGFPQYHEMFKEIYEDAQGAVDPLAENLRKLGDLAPCCLQEMSEIEGEERYPEGTDGMVLAADLIISNTELLGRIKRALAEAAKADNQGLLNFLAERQDMHAKWAWQLKALMQGKEVSKRIYDPEKRRMKRMNAYVAATAAGSGLAGAGAIYNGVRGANKLKGEGAAFRRSSQDLGAALKSAARRNPKAVATVNGTNPVGNAASESFRAITNLKQAAKHTKQIKRAGKLTALSAGLGGAAIYLNSQKRNSARPYSSWMDGKRPAKKGPKREISAPSAPKRESTHEERVGDAYRAGLPAGRMTPEQIASWHAKQARK